MGVGMSSAILKNRVIFTGCDLSALSNVADLTTEAIREALQPQNTGFDLDVDVGEMKFRGVRTFYLDHQRRQSR